MNRNMLGIMPSVLVFALALSASAQEVEHTTEPLDRIKAKVEAKKAILADLRERGEWDQGHVKEAVFLPLSKLAAWERDGISDTEKAKLAKSLPKGTVVYCHCAAGGRSLPGAEILKTLGYDARPLKPGYRDLIKAGFAREPAK